MKSGISGQLETQRFNCREHITGIVGAAQSRFPRIRHAVKDGRYAVGNDLSVGVNQG